MRTVKNLPAIVLAASLSALGLGSAGYAHAETLACSSLSSAASRDEAASGQMSIVKVEKLYRWQQRPWARIPTGAALHVKVPAGTTAADVHNLATNCARTKDQGSPLAVDDSEIKVTRSGGLYVINITNDARPDAIEIQKRAERL